MRDWTKTLRRASFRGVDFWVEDDTFTGGKRVALHEYAGGRYTYLEEMGLATAGYEVTAYLIGDRSDAQASRLSQAALAAGPGRLVLPIDGGRLAYVGDFQRRRSRDQLGYIAFTFMAIPVGNEAGAVLGVSDMTAAVLGDIGAAAQAFGRFF
ncbi:DNA circularization N-terminal domain-containing protein [Shinella zoogloeoides]|uniref:DNA circularization N-terminal domain-containing protein n=1 Tax=Shinella zoogloeoides TaxID=352475 RepID=UPI0028A6C526|nr:DNA circularization N-terminal domain-containing protein [Shinella zoogloeoides]